MSNFSIVLISIWAGGLIPSLVLALVVHHRLMSLRACEHEGPCRCKKPSAELESWTVFVISWIFAPLSWAACLVIVFRYAWKIFRELFPPAVKPEPEAPPVTNGSYR